MMDLELPPPGLPSQQVLPGPQGPTVVPGRDQGREGAAARHGQPQPASPPVCGRSLDCSGRALASLRLRRGGVGRGSGAGTLGAVRGVRAQRGGQTDNLTAASEGDWLGGGITPACVRGVNGNL